MGRFMGRASINLPPVLAGLLAINVAVSLLLWGLMLINALGDLNINVDSLLELPADLISVLRTPWTVLTYMITQVSPLHLIVNMVWLYCFGVLLLRMVSQEQLLVVYLLGGLSGALFFLIVSALTHHSADYLCGASASVLAMMTVTAIMLPDYEVRLWLIGNVKLRWIAMATIILLFLWGIPGNLGELGAHAGGIIAGGVYALWRKRCYAHTVISTFDGVSRFVTFPKKSNRPGKAPRPSVDPHVRLDELLDKINRSGYNSLSRAERSELDELSNKI